MTPSWVPEFFSDTILVNDAPWLMRPGPATTQIGTDGAFLWTLAVLNHPPKQIDWDTNPASPTFGNANS